MPSPERRDADPDLAWGDTLLSPAVQDTWDTSPTMAPPPPRVRRMSREDTVGRDADRPPDIPQTRASFSCTPLSAHTSGLHAQHSCTDHTAQTHGYCSSTQSRPHTPETREHTTQCLHGARTLILEQVTSHLLIDVSLGIQQALLVWGQRRRSQQNAVKSCGLAQHFIMCMPAHAWCHHRALPFPLTVMCPLFFSASMRACRSAASAFCSRRRSSSHWARAVLVRIAVSWLSRRAAETQPWMHMVEKGVGGIGG